jgi:hypothetical protein
MRVISIEKIEGGFAGFIDDGKSFVPFTALKDEPVEREQGWPKTDYLNYQTFAEIIHNFDSETRFLKKPFSIKALTYDQLNEAYCALHKQHELSHNIAE